MNNSETWVCQWTHRLFRGTFTQGQKEIFLLYILCVWNGEMFCILSPEGKKWSSMEGYSWVSSFSFGHLLWMWLRFNDDKTCKFRIRMNYPHLSLYSDSGLTAPCTLTINLSQTFTCCQWRVKSKTVNNHLTPVYSQNSSCCPQSHIAYPETDKSPIAEKQVYSEFQILA